MSIDGHIEYTYTISYMIKMYCIHEIYVVYMMAHIVRLKFIQCVYNTYAYGVTRTYVVNNNVYREYFIYRMRGSDGSWCDFCAFSLYRDILAFI